MKLSDLSFKFQFIKIFLLFSYIVCWFSISTTFEDLYIFKNFLYPFYLTNFIDSFEIKKIISSEFINLLRHSSVYLCFIILLFLFFLMKKKLFEKENAVFYILLIYFLLQLPGLVYTENSYQNISFIISALTIILTIILINYFFSAEEKRILVFISFTLLTVIFLLTFFPKVIEFLGGVGSKIYGGYVEDSKLFISKTSPRSSGVSRSCLVLILLSSLIFDYYFKNKKLLTFLRIFFLTIILLYQSRTIIFLTIFVILTFIILEKELSIKSLFKSLFYYICIPVVIFFIITNYGENQYALKRTNLEKEALGLPAVDKPIKKYKQKNVRDFIPKNFSSGRFEDWYLILNKIEKDKILFGYGAQGDRHLINQSASNGLIYSFISSGIFGSIFFIFFSVVVFFQSLKNIFLSYKTNKIDYIYGLIVLTILGRSVLETSYAVFSIDLIVLITALCLNTKYKTKI
jgi:hypothetical protein